MSDERACPTVADGLAVMRRRWPGLTTPCAEELVFVLGAGWRSGSTLLQPLMMPACFFH
jgi:hypothetical protein